jgi:hypothetical protein
MNKMMRIGAFCLAAALLVSATAHAQALTGSLIGKVLDSSGLAVPGATVTVAGPALMTPQVVQTNGEGTFRVVNLPPGTYSVTAELQGFRKVVRENIALGLGMELTLNITLSPSGVAEAVTVRADNPVIDIVQTKNTQNITKEALALLPVSRDIIAAAQLAPGVVERTVMGSARNDTAYLVDGANVNAPDQGFIEANIAWDTIDEVEFVTTGSPVETYGTIGGVLNLVTKSGGNRFSGLGQYYYTNKSMAQALIPTSVLQTLNIGKTNVPIHQQDGSLTLGGPAKRNRIWFFGAYVNHGDEIQGAFRPTTILGKPYSNYNAPYSQNWAFGKVTAQITKAQRAFLAYNWTKGDRQNDFSVPFNRALDATRHWQAAEHTVSANYLWTIGAKTYLDARAGGWVFDYDGLAQPGTENRPAMRDVFTTYTFNRLAQPDATAKRNYSGSVKLTRYVSTGRGSHDLRAGFDVQHGYGAFVFYSPNSLQMDVYNDNIYYYRGLLGLTGPSPTFGDGRVIFRTAATTEGGSRTHGETLRYGTFVEDTWRINNRTSLSVGVRYDTTGGFIPGSVKEPSDALSAAVGEAVLVPKYGVNPYAAFQFPEWKNPIPWSGVSPQAGVSYDLFGTGRTALKAQWARYQERMPTGDFSGRSPAGNLAFTFNWFDLNNNGIVDRPGLDRYEQTDQASPLSLLSETWRQSIDPKLKTPYVQEFTVGVGQQLAHKVAVNVLYVFRDRKNLVSDPNYDLTTQTFWNTADSGYWVPFTTTVPAVGTEFAAQPITMYFQKVNAPALFRRLTNVPGGYARYQAVNMTVNRRMSDGWQLGASLVLSKNYGNYPVDGSLGGKFQTPNYILNRNGRQSFDRPVQVKLWGSLTLPYQVVGSIFYNFASGVPWQRTVTVMPPAEWAAANGTLTSGVSVLLEPLGTRREQSTFDLSTRFEKQFTLGNTRRIGAFLDVFNLLGFSRVLVQANPAGNWRPVDNNTDQGTFAPGSTGPTGQTGVRILKVAVRYMF